MIPEDAFKNNNDMKPSETKDIMDQLAALHPAVACVLIIAAAAVACVFFYSVFKMLSS